MELIFLYFWMKLNTIISFCNAIVFLVGFLYLFLCASRAIEINGAEDHVYGVPYNDDKDKTPRETPKQKRIREWKEFFSKRWVKVLPIIISVAMMGMLFIPTGKETAILVAGHYALQFSNSEEGKKVKTLIQLTANNMLDDAIKSATK